MSRFQAGDVVRVLSYDEIERQFISRGSYSVLPSGCMFPPDMKRYCGLEKIVRHVHACRDEDNTRYYLDGIDAWTFTHEMLEFADIVVPNDELDMSFDDLMNIK